MSRVIECDDTEFFTRTLDNSRTFVVDFNATWCRPCREMAPIFNSLSKQFPYLTFLSVDIDKVSFYLLKLYYSVPGFYGNILGSKYCDKIWYSICANIYVHGGDQCGRSSGWNGSRSARRKM